VLKTLGAATTARSTATLMRTTRTARAIAAGTSTTRESALVPAGTFGDEIT
jgi:hypothetical protein